MSGWGLGWFGGGAKSRQDAPKKAILQLREQLEMLSKREKHLQNQIDEQDALARKYVSSNKNSKNLPSPTTSLLQKRFRIFVQKIKLTRLFVAAKAALRRKKQFEHALENTNGQIMTLEREIYSIETANINKETLEAMKNASNAMKVIHGGLTIDKVDQTMYVRPGGCYRLRYDPPATYLDPVPRESRVWHELLRTPFSLTLVFKGRNYANNTPSAKKSARRSPNPSATKAWTRPSWTRNSRRYSRKSWTRRCSRLARRPQTDYRARPKVSRWARRPHRRRTRRRS